MLTPYENAVLNVLNNVTSLSVCMVVPAMALRGRGSEVLSVNNVAWVEFFAMCIPLLVGLICLLAPVPLFFRKKQRAARNAYDAKAMHDLCLLISRMSHTELNEVMAGLIDIDMHTVKNALRIVAADLCHLQGSKFSEKRTIRDAQRAKPFNEYEVLKMIEREVVDKGRCDFQNIHDRALIHWVLDEINQAKTIHDADTAPDEHVQSPATDSSPGSRIAAMGSDAVRRLNMIHQTLLAKIQQSEVSQTPRSKTSLSVGSRTKPHVNSLKDIWKFVDKNHNGELTKEEFVQAGWESTPLCTRQDLEQCFELFDVDGSGVVNEEKFFLIVKGMVYGGSSVLDEGEHAAVQRLSMHAPGGDGTLDRRSRLPKLVGAILKMQRHFRAQEIHGRADQNLPDLAPEGPIMAEMEEIKVLEDIADEQNGVDPVHRQSILSIDASSEASLDGPCGASIDGPCGVCISGCGGPNFFGQEEVPIRRRRIPEEMSGDIDMSPVFSEKSIHFEYDV